MDGTRLQVLANKGYLNLITAAVKEWTAYVGGHGKPVAEFAERVASFGAIVNGIGAVVAGIGIFSEAIAVFAVGAGAQVALDALTFGIQPHG